MAAAVAVAGDTGLLTPQQLYSMSDQQRNAYYGTLSKEQADSERMALAGYIRQINDANRMYFAQSLDKFAVCPPTTGGTSAVFATNSTLYYNFPTAGGAYIRAFDIIFDIKVSLATGTSAAYAWTPAGALAWLSQIIITYNGAQATIRPYFIKVLEQMRFKQWLPYDQVLSGLNADSTITAQLAQAQPSLAGGSTATSRFRLRIPLQLLRWSAVGVLPSQGQGTKGQISLQCAGTLGAANADPMQVPILFTTGSGHSVTLDASEKTIQVNAVYNDGVNMGSKTPLALHLEGLPTLQWVIDNQLNPLTAGTVQRQRISTLQKHVVALAVIIDGVQSTSFSTAGNITSIELDQDSAGANKFWLYGPGNNTTFYDYAHTIRQRYGQDFDTGVIVLADALHSNIQDPDNAEGMQYLNMSPGSGWPDVSYGVQVASVSTTNFTPRIEVYLLTINDAGLTLS